MINENITVRQFLELSIFYDLKTFQSMIIESGKPESVGGHKLPENLDSISYGQRLDLMEMKTDEDAIFMPCEILFKMTRHQILSESIYKIAALSKWVVSELNRMTERENRTLKYNPEPEELRAGINRVNFGAFGLIDTIVKTRPVYTHEDVLSLSCSKIYAMQLIDYQNRMFEKRLRKEYSKK